MKINLDITGVDFVDSEVLDFYDGKIIFFELTNQLPKILKFKILFANIENQFDWGQYINVNDFPNIRQSLDKKETRVTINGYSEITFEDVIGGQILITPYYKNAFVKLQDGTNYTIKRDWNLNLVTSECFCYWLDTLIFFPYGACDFRLYTKGKVNFEFDPEDCVSGHQKNPHINGDETILRQYYGPI